MKRALIMLWGAIALSQIALAQPTARPVFSLESRVDEASLIFVGHITEVQVREQQAPLSTVTVDEFIRGNDAKRSYDLAIWKPVDELADLKRRGVRLILFVKQEAPQYPQAVFQLSDSVLKAPLADFTFLKGGISILKFVKDRVQAHPEASGYYVVPLLEGEAGSAWHQELVDSGDSGSMISGLAVPIDARLEKWARSSIHSKDLQLVSRAIAALGYFKSTANIDLVKTQLTSNLHDAYYDQENNGYEMRMYRIRRQAHEILTKWGVDVEQPLLEERVPVFDELKELYWQGPVTSEKLQILPKFKKLANLQFFTPKLTHDDMVLISQVKTLTDLGLGNTEIADNDLAPLAELPRLEKLSLANLSITDEGLKHVAKIKSLREVWVAGTELTQSGLLWLADQRPDIKVTGVDQLNPALRYAMRNDVEGLKRLASRDPKSLQVADSFDNTALHVAAQFGAYDAALYLIEQGADVNAINKDGMNPLVSAAANYRPNGDLMMLLVHHGVDIDRPDSKGWTALQHLAITGTAYQTRFLLNSGGDPSRFDPAWVESLRGRPEIAQLLKDFDEQKQRIPTLLELVKGESPREVYSLKTGSTDRLTTTGLGPFTGDLVWSGTPTKRPYLGPLGQQKVSLQLGDLPQHRLVTVELEVFLIGSWDGNGDGEGPDILNIEVPGLGTLLYSSFYNNPTKGARYQSFPDIYRKGFHEGYTGATEAGTLAFPGDNRDSVYRFTFTFAHTGPDFQLDLKGLTVPQGGLGGLLYDERWGITSLKVKTD
jgi:hypothetical protein